MLINLLPIQTLAPQALYQPNPAGVTDKQTLYTHMCNSLYQAGLINNKSKFFSALMERDEMGPTFVSDQRFAIPHGQDVCVLQPSLSMCLFTEPIDFLTPFSAGKAEKVFLFALPEHFEEHPAYATLQAFSAALVSPGFVGSFNASTPYINFCQMANAAMQAVLPAGMN